MPKWYQELYRHFPDYDEEPYVQNTGAEVDFVEGQIGSDCFKKILDVGCGTGRHTLELARRGYDVVGVDLSPSMLDQGRQIARAEGLDVTFIVADARALPWEGDFDVVLMLCEGGFSLMETDEMDRLILQSVARALRPGGRLLMTAPHAAFLIAHEPEEGAFDLVTFRETFELETTDERGRSRTLQASQRYYTCPELKWLLTDVGFTSVAFFAVTEGGYTRDQPPSRDHFEFGALATKLEHIPLP